MKKIFRIALILALLFVLAVAAALVVLKVKFPEERLKRLVTDGIRNSLMRESSVKRILIGPGSVRVFGFMVSELPDFSAGSLFSAGEITVRARLLPLFRRRLVIRQALIAGPELHLVRYPDNSFNFAVSFGGGLSAPRQDGAGQAARPASWAIERAELFGGKVIYDDRRQPLLSSIIQNLRFEASNITPGVPFEALLAFEYLHKKQRIRFEGNLEINEEEGTVEFKEASIEAGKGTVEIQGVVSGIVGQGKAFSCQLRVAGDRSVLDTLGYLYPPLVSFQLFEADRIDVIISGDKEGVKVRSPNLPGGNL